MRIVKGGIRVLQPWIVCLVNHAPTAPSAVVFVNRLLIALKSSAVRCQPSLPSSVRMEALPDWGPARSKRVENVVGPLRNVRTQAVRTTVIVEMEVGVDRSVAMVDGLPVA